METDVLQQLTESPQAFPPNTFRKGAHMFKVIGTIGAVAAAMAVCERAFYARARRQPSELESVAAAELRKILIYAAPPTFLARVSAVEEKTTPLRWMARAAGN
jgi:hypothetical protein